MKKLHGIFFESWVKGLHCLYFLMSFCTWHMPILLFIGKGINKKQSKTERKMTVDLPQLVQTVSIPDWICPLEHQDYGVIMAACCFDNSP